jgi:hypothetical protein
MPLSPDTLLDAGFGVSKLQTWRARDGEGYTFVLTYRGAPVASVEQGGYGGATDLRWLHLRWDGSVVPLPTPATARQRLKAEEAARVEQEAKAAFDRLVAEAPPVRFHGMDLTLNSDLLLGEILDFHERRKLVAKKIVFTVPSEDGLDQEYTVKGDLTPATRDWILKRHPTATILNEVEAYTRPLSVVTKAPTPAPAPARTGFSAFLKKA